MKPSAEALALAQESELSEEFCEAVLQECAMWNGRVVHTCPGAILTELRPSQHDTVILIANAGLDQSNVGEGFAVGWPLNPALSAQKLRMELEERMNESRVFRFSLRNVKRTTLAGRSSNRSEGWNNEQRVGRISRLFSLTLVAPPGDKG